ncbi:glutathione S-transferase family protein [Arenicella xantha]|uniref:Glutathione S-transferase n=1 Tax=Arenicella xantha TaxID=644221 RepID=A0A395JEU6_9GAMM|nr:glutathione S-transferase family protein [Arenicella xantha]RBP47170.1 glutathione S-transferase [Arenicella xantha]
MPELTLHFAPGACSRVTLIALETLEVAFNTELVIFMQGAHKSPKFKQLNPSSKIPVLVADGIPISQNIAILTWLDACYPNAQLLPKSNTPMERAQLLSQLARFPSDLHPLVSRIRVPHFFCDLPGGPERVLSMATQIMREQLEPIEQKLARQPWLAGQQWSVLDAYLHWVWFRITGAGFDATDFPYISAHYSKTLAMPAVKRAIAREYEAETYLESKGLNPTFLNPKQLD